MKTDLERIEQREEELANEEYNISFDDLPPNIKQVVHNVVLHELGMKRAFKFTCIKCGNGFEEDAEGDLIEIYTDIQSDLNIKVLQGVCQECRRKDDTKEKRW